MAKCRCLTTNWKYPLTSGGVAHSRRVLGATLRHHMGCSQLQWQLTMLTPAEPSCIPCIWVSRNAKTMWLVTPLSRQKLCDTGIGATSPGKGASPNVGPNSRTEKCPFPPCKPLLTELAFPGKFHLSQWLLCKQRKQLQDLARYV